MELRVDVDGVNEALRGLRRMDRRTPDAVRSSTQSASDIIAGQVRSRLPLGPSANGHIRSTVDVRSVGMGYEVSAGNAKLPYYGWLDFGGAVGRDNSVTRPFIGGGRYMFRSYTEEKSFIAQRMENAIRNAAKMSGLDPD